VVVRMPPEAGRLVGDAVHVEGVEADRSGHLRLFSSKSINKGLKANADDAPASSRLSNRTFG
jgi:hypothetical protein